ncbi:MAG: fibrinogen-related protein [Myxococcota bacterium]
MNARSLNTLLICSLSLLGGCFGPEPVATETETDAGEETGNAETTTSDVSDEPTATSTSGTAPGGSTTTGGEADESSSDDGADDESSSDSSTGEPPPMEYPASCAEWIRDEPGSEDGIYTIDVDGLGGLEPFDVQCDMTTEGGGWTLVALNDETTTFIQFDRDWEEYAAGFGDLPAMNIGWLGNRRLHALTEGGLQLQVRNDVTVHVYDDFSVGDESSNFVLSVQNTPMSNDGGFFVDHHDGHPFSTWDNDNDDNAANCADNNSAGWWYNNCFSVSIASGDRSSPGAQVYWRYAPNFGGPGWVAWIQLWVR